MLRFLVMGKTSCEELKEASMAGVQGLRGPVVKITTDVEGFREGL